MKDLGLLVVLEGVGVAAEGVVELGEEDPGVQVHTLGRVRPPDQNTLWIFEITIFIQTRSMLPSVSYWKQIPSHQLSYLSLVKGPQQAALARAGYV